MLALRGVQRGGIERRSERLVQRDGGWHFQSGYLVRAEPDIWTPTETLFAAYTEHAHEKLIVADRRWSETGLGKRLTTGGFRKKRRKVQTAEGDQQMRGFHGIRAGNLATAGQTVTSWRVLEDDVSTIPADPLPERIA